MDNRGFHFDVYKIISTQVYNTGENKIFSTETTITQGETITNMIIANKNNSSITLSLTKPKTFLFDAFSPGPCFGWFTDISVFGKFDLQKIFVVYTRSRIFSIK